MTDNLHSDHCERSACKALAADVERYRKGMFQESAHLLNALDEIDLLREQLRRHVAPNGNERMPLTGLRLIRWKAARLVYRAGCAVSGRHEHLLQWDSLWKERYCPHCGWIPEYDDAS